MIRGKARLIWVIALSAALVGCQSKSQVLESPTTPPTQAVLAKSTLFAQAKSVYQRYLTDLQRVSEDRNNGYERLQPYLSPSAYDAEVHSFEELTKQGLHTVGPSQLTRFKAQHIDVERGTVTAYACINLSEVRLINRAGKDVTSSSRPTRQTFLPSFARSGKRVLLEENGTWSGDSVC